MNKSDIKAWHNSKEYKQLQKENKQTVKAYYGRVLKGVRDKQAENERDLIKPTLMLSEVEGILKKELTK